jgi:MFS family permease
VAGTFWSVVGLLSLFSGPLFGSLSDRWGRKAGLAVVFTVQTGAYLLAASGLPGGPLYLSVALFGIAAWSIPSIMAALVGDTVGPARASMVFGVVTFIFGFGQMAGPAAAGFLADRAGSFIPAFYLAAAATAAAVIVTSKLRPVPGS